MLKLKSTAPDPQNVGNPQNVGFWKIRAVLPMTPPNHAKMHLTSYLDITYGIWKCSANLIKKFGTLTTILENMNSLHFMHIFNEGTLNLDESKLSLYDGVFSYTQLTILLNE